LSTPETTIKKQIKQYLQLRGYFVIYFLAGLGAMLGLSDMAALKQGRVTWVEVKTPRGVQSSNQRKFQQSIEMYGGEYVIFKSLDDAIRWDKLKEHEGHSISLAAQSIIAQTRSRDL
jgi:hypothetical protein